MANLYLTLQPLVGSSVGDVVELDGPDARHAATVSRVAPGEEITLGDGLGTIVEGRVVSATPALVTVEVEAVRRIARSEPAIWLAQALAKGDRDELAIQAATELGADGIIPWAASRSVSRWEGAKVAKGHERWSAIVREASKQSARAWIPEVAPLVTTRQLAALAGDSRLLVLDPLAETTLAAFEPDAVPRDLVVVVGPEGGIAPAELETLAEAGAVGIRLGDTILRTSTAGPAALAVLSAKLGRWGGAAE